LDLHRYDPYYVEAINLEQEFPNSFLDLEKQQSYNLVATLLIRQDKDLASRPRKTVFQGQRI
ncbi:hypothetical protein, partial [Nitrosomonas sp. Is37]|uniref:hypothetical protein n=1 Tax=Nitrosomonas sp. Is37 TaxID=3080535 RepID=UPI00294AB02D